MEKKNDNTCTIWLNWPKDILFEVAPRITIRKIKEQKTPDFQRFSDPTENRNQVCWEFAYFPSHYVDEYQPKGYWDAIHFYKEDSVEGILIMIPIAEDQGFSRKKFAEKVIESFTFLSESHMC